MAMQSTVQDPDFISFLFSSKLKLDCFFLVGNKNYMEPERIGVVKPMLMAHSEVLRLELEDSKLAEKGVVSVPDIYPDTFRTFLRYVYGHDTTADLCFDEADNLFYVAEKYMVRSLKQKLATRLMSLLNTENICSLLNNPACYTELELSSAITKILRFETDKVLASPLLLELSAEGFIKILEQDSLNVPEIELWRATLKWAKHKTGSDDGNELRKQMSNVTKHIRICTLSGEHLCREVVPSKVLSGDEVFSVCTAISKQEKQVELTEFNNEIKPRKLLSEKKLYVLEFFRHTCISNNFLGDFSLKIYTKSCDIELLPLECLALDRPQASTVDATYEVGCVITVNNDTDTTETPVTVKFNKQVEYGGVFEIPLVSNGRNVTLHPNSRYTIGMLFDSDQKMYYECIDFSGSYDNNHMLLQTELLKVYGKYHYVPLNHLSYKAS